MADVLILPNIGKADGFFTAAPSLDELGFCELTTQRQ